MSLYILSQVSFVIMWIGEIDPVCILRNNQNIDSIDVRIDLDNEYIHFRTSIDEGHRIVPFKWLELV